MRIHHRAFLVSAVLAAGIATCGHDSRGGTAIVRAGGRRELSSNGASTSLVTNKLADASQCIVCLFGAVGAITIPNF